MSRIGGLFQKHWKSSEEVTREKIDKQCNELVEQVYNEFEQRFQQGSRNVQVNVSEFSRSAIDCAIGRLGQDGVKVTHIRRSTGIDEDDFIMHAEYK